MIWQRDKNSNHRNNPEEPTSPTSSKTTSRIFFRLTTPTKAQERRQTGKMPTATATKVQEWRPLIEKMEIKYPWKQNHNSNIRSIKKHPHYKKEFYHVETSKAETRKAANINSA